MARREFHLIEGTASKFWAIELNGTKFSVHYGRIGTSGQAQEKTFASDVIAKKEYDKLVTEKQKKGYNEVGTASTGSVGVAPVPKVATPKPAIATQDAQASSPDVKEKDNAPSVAAQEAPSVQTPAQDASQPSASVATAPLPFERRIKIDDATRSRLTWTKQFERVLTRPTPPQYSEQAKKAKESPGSIYVWNLTLPGTLSKEEALLWIEILRAERTYNLKFVQDPTFESLIEGVNENSYLYFLPSPQILTPFLSPLEIARLFIKWHTHFTGNTGKYNYRQEYACHHIASSFSTNVVPYMSLRERDEFRSELEQLYQGETNKSSPLTLMICNLLTSVGSRYIEEFLTQIPAHSPGTHRWTSYYGYDSNGILSLLVGLPDEATFTREGLRLLNLLRSRDDFRLWLAATEWRQLNFLKDSVLKIDDKAQAAVLARSLAQVEAPEAALPMLEIHLKSKAPLVGAEWFAQNPLHAAIGLTSVAMGKGELADAARNQLLTMHRRGQDNILLSALPHLSETEAIWLRTTIIESVQEQLLQDIATSEIPEPLRTQLAEVSPGKPIAWLDVPLLPPIKIYGKKLAVPEVTRLLATLKTTELGSASPLIDSIKEHCESNSIDTFAWALFQNWLKMGAPSKEKWALTAVGLLGGDASVLKLTPLVRDWPGESQHARAVIGLQCLKAIGTDVALMALNGIAQKLKFKALKEQAQVLMNDIAGKRGLTREQLADRIVPDCDLDERGTRVFDFGPRQFQFVLGSEMKPLVRDAEGKMRPDLPTPNKADDAEKAEAAVAEWKLLKKTLREVLKIQAERLEDAMITGRRWSAEEFNTLLLKHPLMVNLVRQIIFGAYDPTTGKLLNTFRGTEDLTLADENDDPAEIPDGAQVGVVHPAHLAETTLSAWGQLLSDYEIIPPFQQLGRNICRPDPSELELTAITRFKGAKIEGIILYGMLERSHWLRDTPADAGCFNQHSKYFPAAHCTAFIHYQDGLSIGYYDQEQEIDEVYFCPGHVKPEMWGEHTKRLKVGQVDSVVISEVLRLASAIHGKAKQ
ncbi:MAG TPA: DUF4132 domain-containing protein [Candidatus Methylacidiphilales bacterium]|nr:DUF4132 domain-containing protein [Candidatus Methylacidiphilales bacterium]